MAAFGRLVPGAWSGWHSAKAMASPAPPSPSVKKSESMARHLLRLGPPSSDSNIRPAGASQKGMLTTNRIELLFRLFSALVGNHDACMAPK